MIYLKKGANNKEMAWHIFLDLIMKIASGRDWGSHPVEFVFEVVIVGRALGGIL